MLINLLQKSNEYFNDKPIENQAPIDPVKHPIASWLEKEGYSKEAALEDEKQFDKTFMEQCQGILNQYSHIMDDLKPEDQNN